MKNSKNGMLFWGHTELFTDKLKFYLSQQDLVIFNEANLKANPSIINDLKALNSNIKCFLSINYRSCFVKNNQGSIYFPTQVEIVNYCNEHDAWLKDEYGNYIERVSSNGSVYRLFDITHQGLYSFVIDKFLTLSRSYPNIDGIFFDELNGHIAWEGKIQGNTTSIRLYNFNQERAVFENSLTTIDLNYYNAGLKFLRMFGKHLTKPIIINGTFRGSSIVKGYYHQTLNQSNNLLSTFDSIHQLQSSTPNGYSIIHFSNYLGLPKSMFDMNNEYDSNELAMIKVFYIDKTLNKIVESYIKEEHYNLYKQSYKMMLSIAELLNCYHQLDNNVFNWPFNKDFSIETEFNGEISLLGRPLDYLQLNTDITKSDGLRIRRYLRGIFVVNMTTIPQELNYQGKIFTIPQFQSSIIYNK